MNIDGKWDVTVTGVRTSRGDTTRRPKDGHIFLLIDVMMRNISMQQLHVSSLIQFHVRNASGQRYNGTLFNGVATPDGVVNSGGFLKGTLAYEVPLTTGSVILSFVSGLGARRVEWNIKVF